MSAVPKLPRPAPDRPLIAGRTVDLELLDPSEHAAGLWRAIGCDPALWSNTPPGPFDDEAGFTQWLEARARRTDIVLYAIVDKRQGRRVPAGLFFLIQINPAVGTVEMGLVYGPALARQTGGTEAFRLLAGYLLADLAYRRLEWRCSTIHEASRKAAARFGFQQEGILRQQNWVKGRSWDTVVYAILDWEWPGVDRRLSAWLAPSNFASDGRQLQPLSSIG